MNQSVTVTVRRAFVHQGVETESGQSLAVSPIEAVQLINRGVARLGGPRDVLVAEPVSSHHYRTAAMTAARDPMPSRRRRVRRPQPATDLA